MSPISWSRGCASDGKSSAKVFGGGVIDTTTGPGTSIALLKSIDDARAAAFVFIMSELWFNCALLLASRWWLALTGSSSSRGSYKSQLLSLMDTMKSTSPSQYAAYSGGFRKRNNSLLISVSSRATFSKSILDSSIAFRRSDSLICVGVLVCKLASKSFNTFCSFLRICVSSCKRTISS